jgi:hypothetical protein
MKMIYQGYETEKFTKGQFHKLPRMGWKTISTLEAAGAVFAPEPADNGFDPCRKGRSQYDPVFHHEKREDRDDFFPGALGCSPEEDARAARCVADRAALPQDQYGNILDGGEEI